MSFIPAILRQSNFGSFTKDFESHLIELEARLKKHDGHEEARLFIELLTIGSWDLALFNNFLNSFPNFPSIPVSTEMKHLVAACTKDDCVAFCEHLGYPDPTRPILRSRLTRSKILSSFMPFSGDILKFGIFTKLLPPELLGLRGMKFSELFHSVSERIRFTRRIEPHFVEQISMLFCLEMPIWKLGEELAFSGLSQIEHRRGDYAKALHLFGNDALNFRKKLAQDRANR